MNGSSFSVLEGELREAGLRVTTQRMQILRIVTESDEHLSAEDIQAMAHEQDGSVSLATTYRTLKALKDAGLVEPHYLGRNHQREHFERTRRPDHFHFKCQRCHSVFEFENDAMRALKADLQSMKGWELKQACMCFEGICHQCVGFKDEPDT